jgi:probable rRNA maturation factor
MPELAAPDVEIITNAPCWDEEPAAHDIVRRALAAVIPLGPDILSHFLRKTGSHFSGKCLMGAVTVVLTDDAEIKSLNSDWRGFDKPTNVLSFPAAPSPGGEARPGNERLGDVIIAYETVKREAADEGKPFANHLSHLAVHGFLHLVGYDHDTDAKAAIMEGLERKALASLGIPDPYEDDSGAEHRS